MDLGPPFRNIGVRPNLQEKTRKFIMRGSSDFGARPSEHGGETLLASCRQEVELQSESLGEYGFRHYGVGRVADL